MTIEVAPNKSLACCASLSWGVANGRYSAGDCWPWHLQPTRVQDMFRLGDVALLRSPAKLWRGAWCVWRKHVLQLRGVKSLMSEVP